MRNFEDEAFELSEDERAAMMLTLNECLDYATDAQLQAIHSYALEIAPLPHCDSVDRERANALHKNVSDIIISVGEKRTPAMVYTHTFQSLKEAMPDIDCHLWLDDCHDLTEKVLNLKNKDKTKLTAAAAVQISKRLEHNHLAAAS